MSNDEAVVNAQKRSTTPLTAVGTDPSPRGAPVVPHSDESLFSLEPLRRWAKFTRRAVRRHWIIAIGVFVVTAMLGGILFASSPPQYITSARILLAGDRVLGGTEGVTSTASSQAESVIHRRESLDQMIDRLNLIDEEIDLPFFGRLGESLFSPLSSTKSDEEKATALRLALRSSIAVFANDQQSSIDIDVMWSDPEQAAALAQASYDVFIQERTRVEVAPLEEAVDILVQRSSAATEVVEQMRSQLGLDTGQGAPAGSELEGAVMMEQDLLQQLRAAELTLDEAKAGIAFRYALLAPPEVPIQPTSGNLAGYLATLILACIAAAGVCLAVDAPRGRIVASWQLEDLGVPVLARIRAEDYVA